MRMNPYGLIYIGLAVAGLYVPLVPIVFLGLIGIMKLFTGGE
ncbi:hypothetical protein LCGC14_0884790 [marine sediment metagenome]|uniref:Uncharacterized protein n=1 Tax=marine sediment metagenome TaxID=412755 RepID=A0A0F9PLJ1_9ZZZZ